MEPVRMRKLGVIDLSSFYADTDDGHGSNPSGSKTTSWDVARLISRLKREHVDGIIIDLRRNGGGYLEEAIKLTGLFIPRGPVVQTKDPTGDILTDSCNDEAPLYNGPLILLTSRFSASASEILAGALQDYGRALIVGDKSTFGKGTVQTMQSLSPYLDQQRMHYAFDPRPAQGDDQEILSWPAALSTQLKPAVLSDIELPSVWSYADVGESSLPNAMPWDEVSSADPVNLDRVVPYASQLRQLSSARVAADPEFAYVNKKIARYKKAEMADKPFPHVETQRVAEQKDLTDENEAYKRDRAARKNPAEKVYELTLKNISMADLQPLAAKTKEPERARLRLPGEDEFDPDDALAQADNGEVDPACCRRRSGSCPTTSRCSRRVDLCRLDQRRLPRQSPTPAKDNTTATREGAGTSAVARGCNLARRNLRQ